MIEGYELTVGVPLVGTLDDHMGTYEQPTKPLSKGQPQGIALRKNIIVVSYVYLIMIIRVQGIISFTITAQNREHLFGEICDGVMVLNVAGEMVQGLWYDITNDFPNVALHDFVVMPNHIHGIIQIKYRDTVGVPLVGTLNVD